LIQTKPQLITVACNGGFENKMHHIIGILMLEFTIFGLLLHLCYYIYIFLHVLVWITTQQTTHSMT
jgi:hypothetical protein